MAKKNKAIETTVDQSCVEGATQARFSFHVRKQIQLATTPPGEYSVESPAGEVAVQKTETGRISYLLNGESVTYSVLYNTIKDFKPSEKSDKPKKADKKKGKKKEENELTETAEIVVKVYKKKQLFNIVKEGQFFKKKVLKTAAATLEEKKITGTAFVAAIEAASGEVIEEEILEKIFSEA